MIVRVVRVHSTMERVAYGLQASVAPHGTGGSTLGVRHGSRQGSETAWPVPGDDWGIRAALSIYLKEGGPKTDHMEHLEEWVLQFVQKVLCC